YSHGRNLEGFSRKAVAALSVEDTHALLHEVPLAYHTQINDVLLAALALTLSLWTRGGSVLVDVEGHGREDILSRVDLSRTLGWFTSIYPVRLEGSAGGDRLDLRGVLLRIRDQLSSIPNRGIGYGILRYLSPDGEIRKRLTAGSSAQVSFNYFGQLDQAIAESSLFEPASDEPGPSRHSENPRRYLLDVDASIVGGQLRVEWTYSNEVYSTTVVEALAQRFNHSLSQLIEHCRQEVASRPDGDAKDLPVERAATPAAPQPLLVVLADTGTMAPFFCVHPRSGEVFPYAALAHHIGPEWPVYALRARGLEPGEEPSGDIRAMAADYLATVRQAQPRGPYFLGGWSFGGTVAFEMAQQLQARGERVSLLALLDVHAHLPPEDDGQDPLARMLGLETSALAASLRHLPEEERLQAILAYAQESGLLPPGMAVAQLRRLVGVYNANREAMSRYKPQPYSGNVTLLRAKQRPTDERFDHGWGAYVRGRLTILEVPGSHDALLTRRFVHSVADRLRECLIRAQQFDLDA
ncbi:MAG TPA: condensation domain-containing protein, partial [Ktedonobacterales bacterium]|nr:condensation domain-containing protein [Ktedonobacterales bacterium]